MKKSLKIGLGITGGLVAITGIATGTAIALQPTNTINPLVNEGVSISSSSNGSIVNSTTSRPTFNVQDVINANKENTNKVENKKDQQIATFSITPEKTRSVNPIDQTYTLTINNVNESLGKIVFTNFEGLTNEGTTISNVKPTDQIFVKSTDVAVNYTLYDLEVFCEGNESYTLDTYQVEGDVYSFTLPPVEINGEQNPFYNGSTSINVKATFAESKVNGWEYNFNLKSYMYQVTKKGFVLDDSLGNFAMKDISKTDIPVKYILDLNGFDIGVKTFTIPKGCDLIIINTKEGTMPTIKNGNENDGSEQNMFGHIRLGGCLTEYNKTFKWGLADYSGNEKVTWTEYVEISSFYQLGVEK